MDVFLGGRSIKKHLVFKPKNDFNDAVTFGSFTVVAFYAFKSMQQP
jgi:hypothetical protein